MSAPAPQAPSLANEPWLKHLDTRAVLDAIEAGGHEARVVGGSVRNALLGAPVRDIDIATTATPQDVVRAVEARGLRAVPTGIDHGTVTVISGHHPYEVTTLRADVETDGRRATVAFTTDWAADASRRDFTINALYCDKTGHVFDPLGGYADLAARRVRFIGNAHDRIREDYLRILRFFRFSAEYATGAPDPEGLMACRDQSEGLSRLSAERVRAEVMRLLAAPRALDLVRAMESTGVLQRILPDGFDVDRLARLADIEADIGLPPDAELRLAVLAASKPRDVNPLRDRLRLSNAEADRMAEASLVAEVIARAPPNEAADRVTLYRHGVRAYGDGFIVAACLGVVDVSTLRERLSLPERWSVPELPVRGTDIVEAGLLSGPAVGRVLREFEAWWIAEGFPAERNRLAHALSKFVKRERGEG